MGGCEVCEDVRMWVGGECVSCREVVTITITQVMTVVVMKMTSLIPRPSMVWE